MFQTYIIDYEVRDGAGGCVVTILLENAKRTLLVSASSSFWMMCKAKERSACRMSIDNGYTIVYNRQQGVDIE